LVAKLPGGQKTGNPLQQHNGCHYVSFVMYIAGAKFEEHYFNILKLFWVECCAVLVEPPMTSSLPCLHVNISKTKKGMPKRKTPFFFTLKSLSNKQQLFFTS